MTINLIESNRLCNGDIVLTGQQEPLTFPVNAHPGRLTDEVNEFMGALLHTINNTNSKQDCVDCCSFAINAYIKVNITTTNSVEVGVCLSLMDRLIETLSHTHRESMRNAIELPQMRRNPKIPRDLLIRIKYLVKCRFFSNYHDGFLLNTKFSHHISQNLFGSFERSTKAITCFLTGITFINSGLSDFLNDSDSAKILDRSYSYGIAKLVTGGIVMTYPILNAFRCAIGNNPH